VAAGREHVKVAEFCASYYDAKNILVMYAVRCMSLGDCVESMATN
jgi:hypothetical protein